MLLSINSDFVISDDDPYPHLKAIAQSGFPSVHWCHHWGDDFVYDPAEIARSVSMVRKLGLIVSDLHASSGREKRWTSPDEEVRLAGVELVKNRIDLAAALGAKAIVMHLPGEKVSAHPHPVWKDCFARSMETLAPLLERAGIALALENLFGGHANMRLLDEILPDYPPSLVGICYDSGHALITGEGTQYLETHLARLKVLHLHDNDAREDQHRLPFSDKADWNAIASLIARAPGYTGPLTLELMFEKRFDGDAGGFLNEARLRGERLLAIVGK